MRTPLAVAIMAVTLSLFTGVGATAEESFTPYAADQVPQSVVELWSSYDPRAEDLEVQVIKESREDGVVVRYVTFKVGHFKGADARIAAYYCFPDNGKPSPAFVWSHGGGQRAEKKRGIHFAKQGFATVDINWLGRPMEDGVDVHTDWGNVDPTQGPRFYAKAKRKGWKRGFAPDAHTIDTVTSPRNANWFLLAVAARRAITFLEQQPEVKADRIGFAGFSMGGTITSMTAMDPRLKAVAPFVGGTGFLDVDFLGTTRTSLKAHFRDDLALYRKTGDPSAYWPHVTCPVMFISTTNDFHAAFDRIYDSMALLKHKAWRVTTHLHENHNPGPEQWILLTKWFNLHLKRINQQIPVTPPSTLVAEGDVATFTVMPEDRHGRLQDTEIYYSYDTNPCTRFWVRAEAQPTGDGGWRANVNVQPKLPLYVFALCRYKLPQTEVSHAGPTDTLAVNSLLQKIIPNNFDAAAYDQLPKTRTLEDFRHGLQDWSARGHTIKTYKFQNPLIDCANDKALRLVIDPQGKQLTVRLDTESRFLGDGQDIGSMRYVAKVQGDGPQTLTIQAQDFEGDPGKVMQWDRITRFGITLVDPAAKSTVDLSSEPGLGMLKLIEMVDAPPAKTP